MLKLSTLGRVADPRSASKEERALLPRSLPLWLPSTCDVPRYMQHSSDLASLEVPLAATCNELGPPGRRDPPPRPRRSRIHQKAIAN